MCIIQIWTTGTCSSAPKLVEKHMCVLGWISRSHVINGNEIQTSGRRGSSKKIEKLGFLIPVNQKHAWKSWNLAWCHDMAPTCCGKKIGRIWTNFWYKLLANRSFAQEGSWFWEGTCHLWVRNDIRCPPWVYLQRQIRSNRGIVLKFWIIPGSFGIFMH